MGRNMITQEIFIERVTKIFPNYDFSKAIYKGIKCKVQVGCEHGYWWTSPADLYHGHCGCKFCALEKMKQTNIDRYDVEYVTQSSKIHEKGKQTTLERYGVEFSFELYKRKTSAGK